MLKRHHRTARGGPLAAAVMLAALALPGGAAARELRVGSVPPFPVGATLVASDAAVGSVKLTIALAPRNPAALAAYASGVSSPSSIFFHRFLSTAQFRRRFAPSAATVAAVRRSLEAHGLHPGAVDASGLALSVTAAGGTIEHAMRLRFSRVRLRSGRDAYYNVQAPAFDAGIAHDIQAVMGLSTLYPARSQLLHSPAGAPARGALSTRALAHVQTGGPQPCSRAVSDAPGSGGYTADQVASYYNFPPLYQAGDKGQGVTVALYELEPNSPADIAAYQQCYGTNTKISYVKVDQGAGTGSGSGEATLDIDQIIGFAPKVKLLVYQGPNSNSGAGPYDTYAAIANQNRASVVSTSWGNCEPQETVSQARAENTVFEQMAVQGQTLISAAGDSGSSDCFIPGPGGNSDNSLQVDDPASQPFVTGVGGTSLQLGPFNLGGDGNTVYTTPNPPETVWNNSYPYVQYQGTFGITPGSGGGGISMFWPMPAYQSSAAAAAPWLNVLSPQSSGSTCGGAPGSYCRQVPDVSADADPMDGYMTYWNGSGSAGGSAVSGWQSVGGTSAAAPLWAALIALTEASSSCQGNLLGFVNPSLYALASSSPANYASYFNDITANAINAAGNNNDLSTSGNASGLYTAGAGYDMATGLGSPNAGNLAPALCHQALVLSTAGLRESVRGAGVSVRLSATLPAGQSGPVSYHASGLPTGLRLDPNTGLITGRTTRTGVYNTVFSATATSGVSGGRTYVWTVADQPLASKLSLVRSGVGRPVLAFTVSAGRHESPLKTVTVRLPAGVSLRRPLRGITVTGLAGRNVPHRLAIVHGELVITLRRAHSPDRVSFSARALRFSGPLAAPSKRPVRLVLRVTDAAGVTTTVRRSVTPVA